MASKEETTPEEEMECKSFEKSPEGHMMEESAEKTELVAGDTTTFEEFLSLAGTNSFWNHGFACLLFIGSIPPTLIGFSYQFLGTTPEYWCHIQDLYDANWTSQEIIDFAIPRKVDGNLDGCLRWNYNYTLAATLGYEAAKENPAFVANDTAHGAMSCAARDFNLTQYSSTLVTEYDLVCDRRALYSTTTSVLHAGSFVASLLVGYVTDRIGKRRTVLISYAFIVAFGLTATFSSSVEMYIVCQFFLSIFRMVISITEYVLILELSSSKLRTYLSCMWNISFAIGQMLIPLIAYYIREWRYMYLAFLSTYAYAISYFCFLPESPRWLILRGRYKDAINFLKTVARWNGRTLPSDEGLMEMMRRINIKDTEENNQGGRPVRLFLDQLRQLFETKIKIVRTLILFFSWFTITFVYYGVTLISINLGSNEYWYMFFGGLMELPVCFILWPLTHFFGRRLCMASSLLLCVACLLGSLGVEGSILWKTTLALLGKLGISSAFLLVYLLTAEINTTKTRTLAVGISSTVARFGGVSSPYINDILGEAYPAAPRTIFGVLSCIAGFLTFLLPETRGTALPETKTDVETIGTNAKKKEKSQTP
ncbi:solute carrier family 22 member 3-like isoform X2 [Oratosquilla oratoria]|uniref:solute carrier family 22 member 3-like isoform X2 n=1 Tax=Oratosquilla oratoria TaxID=337810 RepID=UPI003F7674BC